MARFTDLKVEGLAIREGISSRFPGSFSNHQLAGVFTRNAAEFIPAGFRDQQQPLLINQQVVASVEQLIDEERTVLSIAVNFHTQKCIHR